MAPQSKNSHAEAAGDYKPGSIKQIKLKNFLTYSNVIVKPGARLNMVVGANGTGKSTILNAICLGLGGEPRLLGRADDARDYVMHGKDKAEIEIEIAPKEDCETHVVKRVIDRNKGSERGKGRGASTFYLNDEQVNVKTIKELVSDEYNISIGNLCTFLPQDKVGNFSGTSSTDLLLETEKTLSQNQYYYKTHLELIEAERDLDEGADDVHALKEKLKRLKHENEQLERAKDLLEEREQALIQADLLRKKKIWLEFESLRERAVELKEKKNEMKEKVKESKAELRPLQEKADRLASTKKKYEAKYKSLDQDTNRSRKEMEKQEKKYETHDTETESILLELQELDSRRSTLEAAVRKAEERVEKLQSGIAGMPSLEEVDKELEDCRKARIGASKQYEGAKRELRSHHETLREFQERATHIQAKVAKFNDDGARRRERIFRQHPNLGKISQWLEKNRKNFRRPVWGPIACEISPKSQNAAAFIESHVPNAALKAFVVETKEDYDMLYDAVRVRMKIPINITKVENGRLEPLGDRLYSDRKMGILKKEHGVIGYLDETFTAPAPVMQALRSWASVHKALVGGEKTQKSVDDKGLQEYLGEPDSSRNQQGRQAFVLFTSSGDRSFKYQGIASRYGNKEISTRIDDVFPSKMLAPGVSPQVKKEAEDSLASVHEEIKKFRPQLQEAEQAKAKFETTLQDAKGQFDAVNQRRTHLIKFQTKLNNALRKLDDHKKELEADDDKEKKKLVKSLLNRVKHTITALEAHAEQQEKLMQSTITYAGLGASKSGISVAERTARETVVEKKKAYEDLEKEAVSVHQDFTKVKKQVGEKKKVADTEAPLEDENGKDLPLKAKLEALDVTNLHEVEIALEDADKKANSIDANPDVIRQYEDRKKQIEELEENLEDLTSHKAMKIETLNQKRSRWENNLETHVTQVNSLFTKYMAEMGCTGEVVLYKGTAEEDGEKETGNFKDWGIQIKVSFREGTKAQVLSAQRHSGGERSVSTIMYLMALQDMMVAPFRCVDEINQGLDERNERLVFHRIVQNSCRKPVDSPANHSGQYFLITPKLLPNLYDMENEALTVLFVFNGVHNFNDPRDWDIQHLLSLGKKRSTGDVFEEDVEEEENSANSNARKRRAKKSRRSIAE